jgi:hypothetical protein
MVSAIVIALVLSGGREPPEGLLRHFDASLLGTRSREIVLTVRRRTFRGLTAPAQIGVLAELAPPKKPLLQRLDGGRRAKVLSALAALIILGFALVLLAWLGARATRRYMHREPLLFDKPREGTPVREKDWTEKPLDES